MLFWKKRNGYTMAEALIVVAVIAVVSVVAFLNLRGTRTVVNIDNTAEQVAALLREARTRANSGSGPWGVHFENATASAPFYALFSGLIYGAPTSTVAGYYRLSPDLCFADVLSGSSMDIVFRRNAYGDTENPTTALRLQAIERCNTAAGHSMTNWAATGITAPDATSTRTGDQAQFIYNGYWYRASEDFAGGANATDTATFHYAQIQSDGRVSSFTTATSTLQRKGMTDIFYYTNAVVSNGHLYLLGGGIMPSGGCDGTTSTISYAQIRSNGSLGPWANTVTMPPKVLGPGVAEKNGYIYMLGGSECWNAASSSVYYTSSTMGGGLNAWQRTTAMPSESWDCFYSHGFYGTGGAFIYGNYLYALCDWDAVVEGDWNEMYKAPINADGSVGAWTIEHPFSAIANICSIMVNSGYFYTYARENFTCNLAAGDLYYSRINANGSIDNATLGGQATPWPVRDLSNGGGGQNTGYFHGGAWSGSDVLYGKFVDVTGAVIISVDADGVVTLTRDD